MTIVENPSRDQWPALIRRPQINLDQLESRVRNIFDRVKTSGDQALKELTFQFDQVKIDNFEVPSSEVKSVQIPKDLSRAIQIAAANIEKFHESQRRDLVKVETTSGVNCWRKAVPIQRVGIYIPGGTAPLFSTVLMLAIPARLAGCKEIILCTPPDKNGNINPSILFAASITGVHRVFNVGGAQAIAALAFGTESIPKVSKIFGPGNQFVTKAKQMALESGVAIDMPAGPSEVLVWADESANPDFVAADLLSQAEHGEDSQVVLLASNVSVLNKIRTKLTEQIQQLPRKAIAEKALVNSRLIVMNNPSDAVDFINEYAPEHLIINTANADTVVEDIYNAGSVFIGNYSPEAAGDYASGTNHTLPTAGFAKAYGGVSLESFQKYITYQKLTEEGIANIGPVVETMAVAEELVGHQIAVRVRLTQLRNKIV